ncbi:GNAT family N-acetyltransferase [Kurthia gibsonii]|uniref:GNAT family N-acetyltransferase n=1 Tax=Kurthia TaxID=1649 RepID=UPI00254D82DD|nr:GNAT family N-acetyltransferase [Kurthia sp. YJT4]WIL39911.1 GNAT family N-acetyltransferase [Kurthia sp. YJT4]
MRLVQAKKEQITRTMEIIEDGRANLKQLGLPQWQNGYPDLEQMKKDVEQQKSYVLMDGQKIIGTVCLDEDGELAYDALNGKWSSNDPYIAIHRMAVAKETAAKGIGTQFLQAIEEVVLAKGFKQIRLDTHTENIPMQRVAKKNHYQYVGNVSYGENIPCYAYEKILTH